MSDYLTVRIEIIGADPAQPDPASVSAFADAALADLRAQGLEPQPVYTGAMGGDVYEIVRQVADWGAANKEVIIALISGVAAPIAVALAERLKPRAPEQPAASTLSVIVIVEGAQVTVSERDLTPDELLHRLLAADPELPQRVSSATQPVVRVSVPPRARRR